MTLTVYQVYLFQFQLMKFYICTEFLDPKLSEKSNYILFFFKLYFAGKL